MDLSLDEYIANNKIEDLQSEEDNELNDEIAPLKRKSNEQFQKTLGQIEGSEMSNDPCLRKTAQKPILNNERDIAQTEDSDVNDKNGQYFNDNEKNYRKQYKGKSSSGNNYGNGKYSNQPNGKRFPYPKANNFNNNNNCAEKTIYSNLCDSHYNILNNCQPRKKIQNKNVKNQYKLQNNIRGMKNISNNFPTSTNYQNNCQMPSIPPLMSQPLQPIPSLMPTPSRSIPPLLPLPTQTELPLLAPPGYTLSVADRNLLMSSIGNNFVGGNNFLAGTENGHNALTFLLQQILNQHGTLMELIKMQQQQQICLQQLLQQFLKKRQPSNLLQELLQLLA